MTFNYQYVVLVLIGTIALLCAQFSISILFFTTEQVNGIGSKNEAFLLSTPRKWIYILLICLCGLHIIIYLLYMYCLASCPVAGACCACYIEKISCANGRHTRHLHPPPLCLLLCGKKCRSDKQSTKSIKDRQRERRRHSRSDHKLWDSQSL